MATITSHSVDPQDIAPAVAAPRSDRFSRNLYKWVLRNGKRYYGTGVWVWPFSRINGEPQPFTHDNASLDWDIWIGCYEDGFVTGSRISSVLQGNFKTWACPPAGRRALDITDWFWSEYQKRGRCLFDPGHCGPFDSDESRFEQFNDIVRKCNWCGEVQHKHIETVIKHVEHWRAAPADHSNQGGEDDL